MEQHGSVTVKLETQQYLQFLKPPCRGYQPSARDSSYFCRHCYYCCCCCSHRLRMQDSGRQHSSPQSSGVGVAGGVDVVPQHCLRQQQRRSSTDVVVLFAQRQFYGVVGVDVAAAAAALQLCMWPGNWEVLLFVSWRKHPHLNCTLDRAQQQRNSTQREVLQRLRSCEL